MLGRPVNVIDVIALEFSVFTSVSLWIRWWAHGACTVSGGGLGIELNCVHHVSTVKGTAIMSFLEICRASVDRFSKMEIDHVMYGPA